MPKIELLWVLGLLVIVGTGLAYRSDMHRRAIAARERLIERIRRGEAGQVLLPIRERYRARHHAVLRRAARSEERGAALARRAGELSGQVWRGAGPNLGFVITVVVLTAAWLILFLLQRASDITILTALGYPYPPLFGSLIAIMFAVAGIIVTGLFGVHHLLPPFLRFAGRAGRVAVALLIIAGAVAFMNFLTQLATYRSVDRLGATVSNDLKILDALRARGGPHPTAAQALDIDVATQNLADDTTRLNASKHLDEALTVAVPPLELMVSAAPLLALELGVVGGVAMVAKARTRIGHRRRDKAAAIRQEFFTEIATLLSEGGLTHLEVDALLHSIEGRNSDDSAGSGPPPGSQSAPLPSGGPSPLPGWSVSD